MAPEEAAVYTDALLRLLEDDVALVRRAALLSLGAVPRREIVAARVAPLLTDPDAAVRRGAASVLARVPAEATQSAAGRGRGGPPWVGGNG